MASAHPGARAAQSSSPASARWCSGSARTSRTSSPSWSRRRPARPRRTRRAARRPRLPPRVPGRAPRRGRRARLDRRRVPVDGRRAGAHRPVGRRGRPAHRVRRRRPAIASRPRRRRDLRLPRAAADRRGARRAAEALVAPQPWGREQWERLANGLTFDGMESWLPWLTESEHVLVDLVPDRRAGRAGRPAPHARPRRRHARRGGRPRRLAGPDVGRAPTAQRSRAARPFDRLLAHTTRRCGRSPRTADGPDTPDRRGERVGPVVGDADAARQAAQEAAQGRLPHRGRRRRRRLGGAHRAATSRDEGFDRARGDVDRQPLERGVVLPSSKLAVLAEADVTGRRRAHRTARPRGASTEGFFDDLQARRLRRAPPPRRRPATPAWSRARSAASSATTCCSSTAATTSSTCRPTRSTRAPVHRRRVAVAASAWAAPTWPRPRRGCAAAVREIAQELVVLYQRRLASPGHAFPTTRRGSTSSKRRSPTTRRPISCTAIDDVKADMESGKPMDRLLCGDVGFGKTEVALRAAFKAVQDGKQVAVLVPTTLLAQQHRQTFSERVRRLPGARRGAVALPHARAGQEGDSTACATARSTSSSARTACSRRREVQATSGCSSSTKSSASACSTRRRSRSCRSTSTSSR